jgi:hypothetical protein
MVLRYASRLQPVLFVALLSAALSMRGSPQAEDSSRLPPADRLVWDLSLSAPPEFGSDALIKLSSESPRLAGPHKTKLLEEAFRLSQVVSAPIKRRCLAMGGTVPAIVGIGYARGIDRLTLQCRVVDAMLPIDPRRAAAMFSQITLPTLPRLSCRDALVYDYGPFYTTLGKLVTKGDLRSSAEADVAGGRMYLQNHWQNITSPLQVGPFLAVLLRQARLSAEDLGLHAAYLSQALSSFTLDGRTCSAASNELFSALGQWLVLMEQQRVPPSALLQAVRGYVKRHSGLPRCAEVARSKRQTDCDLYHALLKRSGSPGAASVRPLEPGDCMTSEISFTFDTQSLWQTPPWKDFQEAYLRLNKSSDKDAVAWRVEFAGLLKLLESMPQQPSETNAEYFYRKSTSYLALLKMRAEDTPFVNGRTDPSKFWERMAPVYSREALTQSFVGFLSSSQSRKELEANSIGWFSPLSSLIDFTTSYDKARLEVLTRSLRSGDETMLLYAALLDATSSKP